MKKSDVLNIAGWLLIIAAILNYLGHANGLAKMSAAERVGYHIGLLLFIGAGVTLVQISRRLKRKKSKDELLRDLLRDTYNKK